MCTSVCVSLLNIIFRMRIKKLENTTISCINVPNNDFKLGLVKPAFTSRHPTVYLSLVFITQGKFFISHTTIIETFHFFRVLFYCFDCNPTQFAPVTTPHHPPIIVVMQNSDLVENWTTLKKGMEEKIDLPQLKLTLLLERESHNGKVKHKRGRLESLGRKLIIMNSKFIWQMTNSWNCLITTLFVIVDLSQYIPWIK